MAVSCACSTAHCGFAVTSETVPPQHSLPAAWHCIAAPVAMGVQIFPNSTQCVMPDATTAVLLTHHLWPFSSLATPRVSKSQMMM